MPALTPEEFEPVRPLLEGVRRVTRPRLYSHYQVFSVLVHLLETKSSFRHVPEGSPPWRSCHEMYLVWTAGAEAGPTTLETALELCGRTVALENLRDRLAELRTPAASEEDEPEDPPEDAPGMR